MSSRLGARAMLRAMRAAGEGLIVSDIHCLSVTDAPNAAKTVTERTWISCLAPLRRLPMSVQDKFDAPCEADFEAHKAPAIVAVMRTATHALIGWGQS